MNLKVYSEIAKQLDFKKYPLYLAKHIAIDCILVTSAVVLLCTSSWIGFAVSQFILAVVFFRGFALMHDAVHQSVSDSPLVNEFAGLLGGVLCFMPFHSWKFLHLEHHQWAGNVDMDPSAKLRKDYDPNRVWKYRILTAVWNSWVPLLGLLQEIVFWTYPLQQLKNPGFAWSESLNCFFCCCSPLCLCRPSLSISLHRQSNKLSPRWDNLFDDG